MTKRILCTLLLLNLWGGLVQAATLNGQLHIYDLSGFDMCSMFQPCSITGDIDIQNNVLIVEPVGFFGQDVITNSVEFLGEGIFTRSDGLGGTITATVLPGQIGAYVNLTWGGNPLPTFMIWNVVNNGDGTSTFNPVDSDGDGVPGHALTISPFPGFTGIFEFTVEETGPNINVLIDVAGGVIQECISQTGNEVSFSANITLLEGAELGSIQWIVDGNPAGNGNTIMPTLGLGAHTISVTTSTTTGQSASATTSMEIEDTTAPTLIVAFVDRRSGEVITQIDKPNAQWVIVKYEATDECDASPATEGIGGFTVNNNDLLKIQGNIEAITLTSSNLDLYATATDASGNISSGKSTLSFTE